MVDILDGTGLIDTSTAPGATNSAAPTQDASFNSVGVGTGASGTKGRVDVANGTTQGALYPDNAFGILRLKGLTSGQAIDVSTSAAVGLTIGNGSAKIEASLGDATTDMGSTATRWRAFVGLLIRTAVSTLTWGATVTPDALTGNDFIIPVTGTTAWTLANPANQPAAGIGQVINITIKNTSGGVIASPALGNLYKVTAAGLTMPANTFNRSYTFRWDGTNWVWLNKDADVSN